MIGVGCIYEWYRDGVVESDDEVAVTFHPETFEPLSIPLVNIRTTLEHAVVNGVPDPDLGDALPGIACSMYYPDRTYATRVKNSVGQGLIPENEQDTVIDYLIHNEVDVKREDALMVIEKIKMMIGVIGFHYYSRFHNGFYVFLHLSHELFAQVLLWRFLCIYFSYYFRFRPLL